MKTTSRIALILLLSVCYTALFAQLTLTRYDSIQVKADSISFFRNPWAGGLNSPQLSPIDLNGDGIKDLFVFERGYDHNILTFINNGTADSVDYTYAPEYEAAFPEGHHWMILVDYNCDGREDIFNWAQGGPSGGMTIYRNDYDSISGLQFTLVSESSETWSPVVGTEHISGMELLYLSVFDMPAITDIDGDGDVDVLVFCGNCIMIEYHRNYSMENHGVCDSIEFVLETSCWGEFSENTQGKITIPALCKTGQTGSSSNGTAHPGGSSLLALDMDGDHDKELLLSNINAFDFNLLHNAGDSSYASMDSYHDDIPDSISPIYISRFPAGYYLDVDNDGLRDLIAAPNTTGGGIRNYNSTWFLKNIGTADSVVFEERQRNMLQSEMVEVGEGANPVFFDHNADGLIDIVVGNYGYWSGSSSYSTKIALLENIGTASSPQFELIDRDWQGISAINSESFYPAFGDLDGDGDEDMIVGEESGILHYYDNTAGAGNTASFTLVEADYMNIDVGQYSAPQVVDVDRDGVLDLLIGERGGTIGYYRNTGSASVANFSSTPTNAKFGDIDVMPACCTGYASPFMTEIDGSGEYFLLVGNERGEVAVYGNIEQDLGGVFGEYESAIQNIDEGVRASISVADINSDGDLEVVIGNYLGGLAIFTLGGFPYLSNQEINDSQALLKVYPNPSDGSLNIELKSEGGGIASYELADLLGRKILQEVAFQKKQVSFTLSDQRMGIYFLTVVTVEGEKFTEKIILR